MVRAMLSKSLLVARVASAGHMVLESRLPRSVGVQYATEYQCRNNSRNNEEMEPKQKQHPVVYVTGDISKI